MLREKVTAIGRDDSGILVRTMRRDHCCSCAMHGGCGYYLFHGSRSGGHQHLLLPEQCLDPPQMVAEGELLLTAGENALMRQALILYLFPLACMLLAAALSRSGMFPFQPGEGMAILLSFSALAAGLLIVSKIRRQSESAGIRLIPVDDPPAGTESGF